MRDRQGHPGNDELRPLPRQGEPGAAGHERRPSFWREPRPFSTGFYGRMPEGEELRARHHDERNVVERAADWAQRKLLGKPPKGYRRSEERIREDVCDRIMQHRDVDASDVEVTVSGGEVTLAGTVGDRWSKRLIEDLAEDVLGVDDVHNRLTVRR